MGNLVGMLLVVDFRCVVYGNVEKLEENEWYKNGFFLNINGWLYFGWWGFFCFWKFFLINFGKFLGCII